MKENERIQKFIKFEADSSLILLLKRAENNNNNKQLEEVRDQLLLDYNKYINESA